MRIGVPKEIKNRENRVGCTPSLARTLIGDGHEVFIERGAGIGSGFDDAQYTAAGARVVDADEAWAAPMVLKVKEPVETEYRHLRPGLVLFCYLHLAADRPLTLALMECETTAIAGETILAADGRSMPLLEPMSRIAGRMAPLVGGWHLGKPRGGSGVLPCGAPGIPPGRMVGVGGGTVGADAARIGAGIGMTVDVLDVNPARLAELERILPPGARTHYSDASKLETLIPEADLLVGAVLIPGARAPRVLRREWIAAMRPGSVLVDVAIDQGGCAETSRPTTHDDPVFVEAGVVHYCVTNMPGAYARTATLAYAHAIEPYVRALAGKGADAALAADPGLRAGLNSDKGRITCPPVAKAHGLTAS
jgi:alanine dehydrogenase